MNFNNIQDYIQSEFSKRARDFVINTGCFDPKQGADVLIKSIAIQATQVREEVDETITAIVQKDRKEILDGIIDTYFTISNLDLMVDSLLNIKESLTKEQMDLLNLDYVKLQLVLSSVVLNLAQSYFSVDDIVKAGNLILENNELKYTESYEEASSWEIDNTDGLNTRLQKVTTESGKVFYSLVDENGKIRKHKNFKKVVL